MDLGESHGHIMLDGADFNAAIARHANHLDTDWVVKRLDALRCSGIRFYRDGGDKCGVSSFARKVAADFGIYYRTPAFAIYPEGHYGGIVGHSFSTLSQCEELIDYAICCGADFIKVMFSGIMDYHKFEKLSGGTVDLKLMQAVVSASHRKGYAVMAHVNTAQAIKNAVRAGADSIEHGYYMDDECLDLMLKSKTIWVPTLSPVVAAFHHNIGNPSISKRILGLQYENIRKALHAGIPIACGSDAGAGGVSPVGYLGEKNLLLQAVPKEDREALQLRLEQTEHMIKCLF